MSSDTNMEAHFSGLSLEEPTPSKFKPVKVSRDPHLMKHLLHFATGDKYWLRVNYKVAYKEYELHWNSSQYKAVEAVFEETNYDGYTIVEIDRIDNPFLLAQYLLKEAYKKSLVGSSESVELFHGTKESYVSSICKTNLDWRWVGSSGYKGNKYGNGVSFSPSASYASQFPRGEYHYPRAMFLCDVLVHKTTLGDSSTMFPPEGADATGSENDMVVVKYDDHEFYPKYVIYYEEDDDDYYDDDDDDYYYDDDDDYYYDDWY